MHGDDIGARIGEGIDPFSGSAIIKCTSSGKAVTFRKAATTGGPIVMFEQIGRPSRRRGSSPPMLVRPPTLRLRDAQNQLTKWKELRACPCEGKVKFGKRSWRCTIKGFDREAIDFFLCALSSVFFHRTSRGEPRDL